MRSFAASALPTSKAIDNKGFHQHVEAARGALALRLIEVQLGFTERTTEIPNDGRVMSASKNCTATVWDLKAGQEKCTLAGRPRPDWREIHQLLMRPEGTR